MKTYVHLDGAASDPIRAVREIIALDDELAPGKDVYTPEFAADMVDVTALSPRPASGWTTTDGGKTFQAPVVTPEGPRPRTATTYILMSVFTDAERAAYANVKAWDQRQFSARDTPWPEDNVKIGRIADVLGTTPKSLFDRALGA